MVFIKKTKLKKEIICLFTILFYLDLIATTGSMRAAVNAGIIPDKIPMMIQIDMARKRMPPETKTGKLNKLVRIIVSKYTNINPIIPPKIHMVADSKRNSKRMLFLLAPIAFFNPIIGVRSFTVTNMMLAIPKAPTTRLKIPMAQPPILILPNKELTLSLAPEIWFREKLSSSFGLSFLIDLITPSRSFAKACELTLALPFTIILGPLFFSLINSLAKR